MPDRNPKISCIYILTEEDVANADDRERRAKENYNNYECAYCRDYVWWDTPHVHRVGEKVKV